MRTHSVRRRRRVSRGNVAAGVVALMMLGALALSPLIATSIFTSVRAHEAAAGNAVAGHVGDVVHDADVDFVVHAVDCTGSLVTDPDGRTFAATNGEFCVVAVTIHNDGVAPVTVTPLIQLATGNRGAVYLPDISVDTLMNGANSAIAPGVSRDGVLIYDVPQGIELTKIQLHASEYSQGVTVRL
jgi:Domain of unknown function (DUF4352)